MQVALFSLLPSALPSTGASPANGNPGAVLSGETSSFASFLDLQSGGGAPSGPQTSPETASPGPEELPLSAGPLPAGGATPAGPAEPATAVAEPICGMPPVAPPPAIATAPVTSVASDTLPVTPAGSGDVLVGPPPASGSDASDASDPVVAAPTEADPAGPPVPATGTPTPRSGRGRWQIAAHGNLHGAQWLTHPGGLPRTEAGRDSIETRKWMQGDVPDAAETVQPAGGPSAADGLPAEGDPATVAANEGLPQTVRWAAVRAFWNSVLPGGDLPRGEANMPPAVPAGGLPMTANNAGVAVDSPAVVPTQSAATVASGDGGGSRAGRGRMADGPAPAIGTAMGLAAPPRATSGIAVSTCPSGMDTRLSAAGLPISATAIVPTPASPVSGQAIAPGAGPEKAGARPPETAREQARPAALRGTAPPAPAPGAKRAVDSPGGVTRDNVLPSSPAGLETQPAGVAAPTPAVPIIPLPLVPVGVHPVAAADAVGARQEKTVTAQPPPIPLVTATALPANGVPPAVNPTPEAANAPAVSTGPVAAETRPPGRDDGAPAPRGTRVQIAVRNVAVPAATAPERPALPVVSSLRAVIMGVARDAQSAMTRQSAPVTAEPTCPEMVDAMAGDGAETGGNAVSVEPSPTPDLAPAVVSSRANSTQRAGVQVENTRWSEGTRDSRVALSGGATAAVAALRLAAAAASSGPANSQAAALLQTPVVAAEAAVAAVMAVSPVALSEPSTDTPVESQEDSGPDAAPALPGVPARENIAVRTQPGRPAAPNRETTDSPRRFLNVDGQKEGDRAERLGTGIATTTRTMSEKPLAQPAAESGRDAFENSPAVSTLLDPRSSPADPPTAEVGLARSFAATAVREVLAAAERAAPTGRTHVDLRLQTFDDENIRVHLQWRDGVIQAKFVTETPELQQALSREWDAATPRFADQGLKFAAPTFERQGQEQSSHPQGSSAFAFDQQRHSRGRQLPDDAAPAFALPAFFAEARRGTDLPADLPALATQLQSGDVSNVRGLRTWA